ncbi:MAG: ABC transporter substrate-binding protein [Alphaproteobacteria bacterium]|nr:ABC transporter substrate-binding protein [Alphaproteobacteria bacterium]
MKKFLLLVILILISIFCYNLTSAKINPNEPIVAKNGIIKFVTPLNYFPISKIENRQRKSDIIYEGVFDTFIDDFCGKNQISCTPFIDTNYINTIKTAEINKLDLIIGIYSDSILYEDFRFIYPSLLDNPVHLVMLPSRIGEITSLKDLKPLKGAINSNDQWNDYILEQFKQFNIEQIDSSEEMYRKLISKEIDFVFTTYWYGISEIMRLGIQDFVTVSQKGLWNMPLFIAVSNYSPKKNYLIHYLTEYLKNPTVTQKIKARAIEVLEEIKTQNHGVVPDSYVLQKDAN